LISSTQYQGVRTLAAPILALAMATALASASLPAVGQVQVSQSPTQVPSPGATALAYLSQRASSLHEAVDAAWLRQPQARAAAARRAELDARAQAAESLSRDAPAVTVENWSDRWTKAEGFAKYAGEFAFPLWLPGERERTRASIAADRDYVEAVIAATKLRVAGDVRDSFWAAQMANQEVEVATLRRDEAQRLSDDLQRRLRAGVVARVDAQAALAQLQLAEAALSTAQAAAFRSLRVFEQLTGLRQVPAYAGEPERRVSMDASAREAALLEAHPALTATQRAVEAARASLNLVAATNRDSPEIGVGMFRERSRAVNPFENIVTLRLRIPFATESRNAPRVAAANVALMEAEAQADLERERLLAELASAEREAQSAAANVGLAQRRRDLAADNRRLVARAFELGEADFATRLRAQTEFFDAELAARRAATELQRARSRVAQAQGLMP
jgi:cobalt-zinc-cadmium efflux system outer membrane protein